MSTPVVIQGTPVSNPYVVGTGTTTPATNNNNNDGNGHIISNNTNSGGSGSGSGGGGFFGTKCNDPLFALLFYINLIAMVLVAAVYGGKAFESTAEEGDESNGNDSYEGYVVAVVLVGVISLVVSGLGLLILMRFPETIIKAALIFVVIVMGLQMIVAFLSGSLFGAILGAVFFAIVLCYARAAWPRIPFATVNLVTAITAVKANFGVVLFNYIFAILAVVWSIIWSVAFAGVFATTYNCDENGENCDGVNYGVLFVLFISLFFGLQVLQNSVHVTVAGTVGTWWVSTAENGFCGKAVMNSFIRTITTSFGSICFGSLLVAILQALRMLAETARDQGDGGIGACIAECILGCLASILEYFNKWAFIYVGVYGQSYIESGKSVFQLFHNRGWEAIIADDLVANALLLVSLAVGLVMGLLAFGLSKAIPEMFENAAGSAGIVAFLLGFLIGLAICSLLLSTVGSGVNAVIVLYADLPREFEQNHPDLSRRMRETWSALYPGSV